MLERNTLPVALSDKDIVGTWGKSKMHQITKSDLAEVRVAFALEDDDAILEVVPRLEYFIGNGSMDVYKGFAVKLAAQVKCEEDGYEGGEYFNSFYKLSRIIMSDGREVEPVDREWEPWQQHELDENIHDMASFIEWALTFDPY